MCAWDEWAAAQQPPQQLAPQQSPAGSSSTAVGCKARLIAQIHGEGLQRSTTAMLTDIDADDAAAIAMIMIAQCTC
jgi:hypothetical protein